jgi:Reverse transcriptase (RNA-dependent DNA polymerase)
MECIGKVLEKIIAKRLGHNIEAHGILRPSQFSSRTHHSATDAATVLRHKAAEVIRARQVGAALLFDISRFFDHLTPATMQQTLTHLGINPEMVAWVGSLMGNRMVMLSFNSHSSTPFHPSLRTPQGSPALPILSALFTSPLLREAIGWEDQDLSLYVDDGLIFASAPTFNSAAAKVVSASAQAFTWLRSFGLKIDLDKTEFMFFHPPHPQHQTIGHKPSTITLQDGHSNPFSVKPTNSICYLSVFFTPKLDWSLHVTTMANRVCSTIKALGMLGNSI